MANIEPFSASFPHLQKLLDSSAFFNEAKYEFQHYVKDELYATTPTKGFYIYEQSNHKGSHTALITLTNTQDYLNGKMVRHEHTLGEKERGTFDRLRERQAMIKPVLLFYPEVEEIAEKIIRYKEKYPLVLEVDYKLATHRFWSIDKPKHVEKLQELFETKIPKSYIGDGHHRAKVYSAHSERLKQENTNHKGDEFYNYLFCAYYSVSELDIHEFNRLVTSRNNLAPEVFLQKLAKAFVVSEVHEPFQPTSQNEVGMYMDGKWYCLQIPKKVSEKALSPIEKLAVDYWNREVLTAILGIEDVRNDDRIFYVEGPKGLESLAKKANKPNHLAFSFYPISFNELMHVADSGASMPPKSTWFEPRIRNGMLVHRFDLG